MNFANLFRIALRALGNNKMRGFLTMLGIIIGVASVITMLAIGQGSKRSIRAQIAEMGSNMIMIHPGADMRGGVRQDPAAMQSLKLDDYQAIVDETRYVSACSPSVSSSGQAILQSSLDNAGKKETWLLAQLKKLGYEDIDSLFCVEWTPGKGFYIAAKNTDSHKSGQAHSDNDISN